MSYTTHRVHFYCAITTKNIIYFIIFFWPKTRMYLAVSGSMEPIKEKKCVMVIDWWRKEAVNNSAVNNISKTLASMGVEVEARKLHV